MKTPPLLLGNGQRRRTCASGTRSDDTSVAATSKDNPRLDASSDEPNPSGKKVGGHRGRDATRSPASMSASPTSANGSRTSEIKPPTEGDGHERPRSV